MDGDAAAGVKRMSAATIRIEPATADRLDDISAIFADCSYGRKCWCAYWYSPNREFKANWGEGNRPVLADRVRAGREPGVIAYVDDLPAGWLGIAPRTEFDRLNRSRPFAMVDGDTIDPASIWAMNCFIVVKAHRRQGLMRALILGGLDHIRARGGKIAEAYPFDAQRKPLADELFVGTAAAFRDCGFVEAARRLPGRPIMRRAL